MQKTIFITILQGVEAKNILRTEVYRNLIKEPNLRLVFFVSSKERADYYGGEFKNNQVVYEVIDRPKASFWNNIFSFLKFKLINTATLDLRRRMRTEKNPMSRVLYPFSFAFNRIFAVKPFRQISRWLDYRLVKDNTFAPFFEKYKPDLVFSAHLFDDLEIMMLQEARRRGIKTIGFINSWDKLTVRCMVRLLPDQLLVYNEIVKKEAMDYADMPEERITIVGIPQYDQYVFKKPGLRETFYKRIGVDPSKKILLYAPLGKTYSNTDWDMVDLLQNLQKQGRISKDLQILMRFQPNDFADEAEIKKRPWLIYDTPGVRFSKKRGVDWDMNSDDLQHLLDTLHYSSMLVAYPTSLVVDIAVFDKPIINIGFEIGQEPDPYKRPTAYYGMAHYQKALSTGAIRVVKSPEVLVEWINNYLIDPTLDQEARKKIIDQQCWKLDGRSGERIVQAMLKI
ncbi:MAG: hypothetical protein G01um10143_144 [Parcubacteria group bacterium Gr01-1014_3]|nr:MAG: hypothetical protein G01um10143_144 [Parcubacteria group bacterium Gr01-1014_3]